jgi:hypothetical protein
VLDDVTVTQVSAVWELKHANPDLRFGDLYRAALRIGRDHIASTVNTLVLAYAGASLPLLLLFTQADQGLADGLNGEAVAVEVVRTLCGRHRPRRRRAVHHRPRRLRRRNATPRGRHDGCALEGRERSRSGERRTGAAAGREPA